MLFGYDSAWCRNESGERETAKESKAQLGQLRSHRPTLTTKYWLLGAIKLLFSLLSTICSLSFNSSDCRRILVLHVGQRFFFLSLFPSISTVITNYPLLFLLWPMFASWKSLVCYVKRISFSLAAASPLLAARVAAESAAVITVTDAFRWMKSSRTHIAHVWPTHADKIRSPNK